MSDQQTHRVTLSLPHPLYCLLAVDAEFGGLSVNRLIREVLEYHVETTYPAEVLRAAGYFASNTDAVTSPAARAAAITEPDVERAASAA